MLPTPSSLTTDNSPPNRSASLRLTLRPERIWVEEYVLDEDQARRWDVFSEDGDFVATVAMPNGFSPQQIANDHVVGIARDTFDVDHVQVRRVVRP